MEKEGFHMGVGLSDGTDILRGLKKSALEEQIRAGVKNEINNRNKAILWSCTLFPYSKAILAKST